MANDRLKPGTVLHKSVSMTIIGWDDEACAYVARSDGGEENTYVLVSVEGLDEWSLTPDGVGDA